MRAVLFDLFDTLVDLHWDSLPEAEVLGRPIRSTTPALHAALLSHAPVDFDTFARALREVDRDLRASRAEAGLELPTIERFTAVLERLGVPDPGVALRLTETHMDGIRSMVRPVAHHGEVLERLRSRARLAICSNFSHAPTARKILKETGLLPLMDGVAISEEVGVRKPRVEIFRAALEAVGASPGETFHVGDQLVADVEGATRAGIGPVWITRCVAEPQRALDLHSGPRPVHIIRDLAELEPLLPDGAGPAPRARTT
jgi:FMN phosphatase YigB (HAD superfamily)